MAATMSDELCNPSPLQTLDLSQNVGTTPVDVFSAAAFPDGRSYFWMRLWNDAPADGGTIWLSRNGVAVADGAGSFPLQPGQYELFRIPKGRPANAFLSAISTAPGTPLRVHFRG